MSTVNPFQNDPLHKTSRDPGQENAGRNIGLGSTSNVSGIRNADDMSGRSGSPTRSASGRDDESRGQVADALNSIVDALDSIVREVPRGAQAQFSSTQEKLTKARASIKSYCDASKSEERGMQRMDNEGANPTEYDASSPT